MHVVWLKRDLRLDDHGPLAEAGRLCETGASMIALYVHEPSVWSAPDADASHLAFVDESLDELERAIESIGGRLARRVGEVVDVLARLHAAESIESVLAHEETGNGITYARDRAVARWCRARGIALREWAQNGVLRPNPGRDGWSVRWQEFMKRARHPVPTVLRSPAAATIAPHEPGLSSALGLGPDTRVALRQRGGSSNAAACLNSFLLERGRDYQRTMGSPVEAWESCSRLSPHLAWGTMSVRRAWQGAARRLGQLGEEGEASSDLRAWRGSVRSFMSRLAWHCHFMQKLEDEPAIEHRCMMPCTESLRSGMDPALEAQRLVAWQEGRTGYPMVDACMRALVQTGWINFRMRAMLVSFASHHLWLDWRTFAPWLGRQFLDYEPGIHYSQVQMQSGTTGINTLRIYSPRKQVEDHDPTGVFIRRWVPELQPVPDEFLAEPALMPGLLQQMVGCRIGDEYPQPIVDHATAYRAAQEALFSLRATPQARTESKAVFRKHGSRKRSAARSTRSTTARRK
jgi:deoxyribodipyrimidine photo-lyase